MLACSSKKGSSGKFGHVALVFCLNLLVATHKFITKKFRIIFQLCCKGQAKISGRVGWHCWQILCNENTGQSEASVKSIQENSSNKETE